mmetsp:Transcript_20551/g.36458  ORF Transcript_20551/g.36458 Transcript_20551/m.36458 type:complete len:495 (-) Transcript_20551:152-1636(-)
MSPPPEQILPNSDDSSSKDEISSGSESANSPLPATPEKRKSRWTKGGVAEEADDSTFSQDAPPPTSFTPPPGSDVVPRKILTPVHHFMAGSRRALWGDLANVTQPPRVYVDGRSIFREISSVTQLRRGDHCMTTLNMLRCLSPQVDYLVSLAGSLELLHCYHHFIMLDDVAVVDAYGVPRNKEGQIATIVEYSNTMPEFYEEVRVLSLNSWLHFPKHLIQQVCLGKAHCHRVPLADYGDMPHIFRIEERLSEEERERIVRDSERLLEDHPTYNMFWANCEHTTNMVSGAKKFTSPEVHFMFWSLFRYLLTLVGLAFLHFLTLRCYSRYCLQDFQWTLGAYYACTALPVLLQILVQFSRMAWNMVSCYLQNLISKDDLYHLLLKELCRAIFNGVLALGFLVWAPDFWHFKEGRLALSVAVVFAYYASDMVYALMAQVVTRLLMNNHGKYWLIGGSCLTREQELEVKAQALSEKTQALSKTGLGQKAPRRKAQKMA